MINQTSRQQQCKRTLSSHNISLL